MGKIEHFKSKCLPVFKERLVCLVLTGSYARNESTPFSDIDIWLLIKDLNQVDLKSVGNIVSSLKGTPEINPQCISPEGINFKAFKEQFNPLQLYLDGIILHGQLPEPMPTNKEIKIYSDSIMAFVMMSARHYISVNESEESLAKGKLRKWILNPIMWSLRYNIFIKTRTYPRTLDELKLSSLNSSEKEFVEIYSKLLNRDYSLPYMRIIENAERYCKGIMSEH